jgi:L-aspartate oxidase
MPRRYLTDVCLDSNTPRYDVVVIGAGVSGLYLVAALPETLKVLVLVKENLAMCNSQLAQGGVALTLDGKYASHIEDTIIAGAYENEISVVRDMIGESETIYHRLEALGVELDRDKFGALSLTREGGHHARRIVHHSDTTGAALMQALTHEVLGRSQVEIAEHAFAIDLVTDEGGIRGVTYFKETLKTVAADCVILATGGIGGWFGRTTNAPVATGDGLAMALRAGLKLRDAAYIQYHPTAFLKKEGGYFLISEAVRGEGGILINSKGERFMQSAHELMELAPRDVVSMAIDKQLQKGLRVFVDVRHLDHEFITNRFPNIMKVCRENGIDPLVDPIPVEPVEHYHMGGIVADSWGRTAVQGLRVTGEAAGTGFHGANRLASNSLLECMALSERIARNLANIEPKDVSGSAIVFTQPALSVAGRTLKSHSEIQQIFDKALPLVKRRKYLDAALAELRVAFDAAERTALESIEHFESYNGMMVAKALIEDALSRSVSVGSFIIA